MKYLAIAVCVIGSAVARPDGAGGHHHHDHSAAAAPATGYSEPQTGYADPGSGYGQPSGYAAPSEYEQPGYDTGYSNSVYNSGYGAVEESGGGLDLTMLLVPVLLLAGLALLFPSVVTVAVRRKRSAEDEVTGNSLVDRIQDIYSSVVQSEECMERVACEVGGIVTDAGISTEVLRMAEPFVSSKYSKLMKRFNTAKDCQKIKCGSLF